LSAVNFLVLYIFQDASQKMEQDNQVHSSEGISRCSS